MSSPAASFGSLKTGYKDWFEEYVNDSELDEVSDIEPAIEMPQAPPPATAIEQIDLGSSPAYASRPPAITPTMDTFYDHHSFETHYSLLSYVCEGGVTPTALSAHQLGGKHWTNSTKLDQAYFNSPPPCNAVNTSLLFSSLPLRTLTTTLAVEVIDDGDHELSTSHIEEPYENSHILHHPTSCVSAAWTATPESIESDAEPNLSAKQGLISRSTSPEIPLAEQLQKKRGRKATKRKTNLHVTDTKTPLNTVPPGKQCFSGARSSSGHKSRNSGLAIPVIARERSHHNARKKCAKMPRGRHLPNYSTTPEPSPMFPAGEKDLAPATQTPNHTSAESSSNAEEGSIGIDSGDDSDFVPSISKQVRKSKTVRKVQSSKPNKNGKKSGVQKPKGGRRDPDKRRDQNVLSQRKYRVKKKTFAATDRDFMVEVCRGLGTLTDRHIAHRVRTILPRWIKAVADIWEPEAKKIRALL